MLDLIKRNLLKYTLLADGIISVTAGTVFLAFAGLVAELIGPALTGGIVTGLGAFLLVWGLFHLALSREPNASGPGVRIAIAGDALWILGSIALLVMGWESLTAVGAVLVAVMTVAVADIMLLKLKGLGDQRRAAAA